MPMSRIMRLRTVAKTGRRMQSSEMDIGPPASAFDGGGGRRNDLDIDAVAQARLSGDHHLLADLDTIEDLDETVLATAGADFRFLGFAVVRLVDEEIVAARHESAFGNGHGGARRTFDGDAGEEPRAQFAIPIGERRLDLDGAAIDIDRRIDGVDGAFETRARQSIGADLDLLADGEL